MRGMKFRGGYHDFLLDTGGLTVFPRLVAAEHHADFTLDPVSSGSRELDSMLGGGLVPGTNTLFVGPSGVGKTTTAIRCVLTALERGEKATYFLFDEGLGTFLARAGTFGMDLAPYIADGRLHLQQVDPAELSPGEFACRMRAAVEEHGSSLVTLDSLNAYLHSMPGEQFLLLQMHEILTYLGRRGTKTLLILGQHGLLGDMRTDVDLSYLSDNMLLFRFFEAEGEIRSALAVVKSRTSAHERTIRELRLSADGFEVGQALTDFEGILGGLPAYRGRVSMLSGRPLDART
jgi:circadian clock protein KaiC